MIPRKAAKRLLAEYVERLRSYEAVGGAGQIIRTQSPEEVATDLLRKSDLVLRGTENVEQKGRRYLIEGRLVIVKMTTVGLIVATCRGELASYQLGYDPAKKQWRCTCQAKGRCSHLAALRLVVAEPSPDLT